MLDGVVQQVPDQPGQRSTVTIDPSRRHPTHVDGNARIEIDFDSGLTQEDDEVDVEVRITAVGRTSIGMSERIVSAADGRVSATAETVMVHTDTTRVASAPWPPRARAALEAAIAAQGPPPAPGAVGQ